MEKILIELQKKGIVNKNKKGYYLNHNGKKRFVGENQESVFEEIERIGIDSLLETSVDTSISGPSSEDATQLSPAPKSLTGKKSIEIENKVLDDDVFRIYERNLGNVYDIKPGTGDGIPTSVGVYDPKSKTYISSKLSKHPVIRQFGLEVRWGRIRSKKKSGEEFAVNGYKVLRKSDYQANIDGKIISLIETSSDDTPGEDFWTYGNLVLAGAKADQVRNRRIHNCLKRSISSRKDLAARQDFANSQAKAEDFDKALKNYESAVAQDIREMKDTLTDSNNKEFNAVNVSDELKRIEALSETDPDAAMAALSSTPYSDLKGL